MEIGPSRLRDDLAVQRLPKVPLNIDDERLGGTDRMPDESGVAPERMLSSVRSTGETVGVTAHDADAALVTIDDPVLGNPFVHVEQALVLVIATARSVGE